MSKKWYIRIFIHPFKKFLFLISHWGIWVLNGYFSNYFTSHRIWNTWLLQDGLQILIEAIANFLVICGVRMTIIVKIGMLIKWLDRTPNHLIIDPKMVIYFEHVVQSLLKNMFKHMSNVIFWCKFLICHLHIGVHINVVLDLRTSTLRIYMFYISRCAVPVCDILPSQCLWTISSSMKSEHQEGIVPCDVCQRKI